MYDKNDYQDGARAIRPYLKELLGAEAEIVDQQLAELLESGRRGNKVENLILETVRHYESTRRWMAEFLEKKLPPELAQVSREYQPPLGGKPVAAPKYACPEGDYTWYRQSVRDPVPTCPTHAVQLVKTD